MLSHMRPTVDSALLLRARRLAKRSRAETACQLCKASKLRCSDYRPCARCKKVGAEICMDPPASAQSKPSTISVSASDRSRTLVSRLAGRVPRARAGRVSAPRTAMHRPDSPAKSVDSPSWRLATSTPPIPIFPQHSANPALPPGSSAPLQPMLAETDGPADAMLAEEQVRRSIGRAAEAARSGSEGGSRYLRMPFALLACLSFPC